MPSPSTSNRASSGPAYGVLLLVVGYGTAALGLRIWAGTASWAPAAAIAFGAVLALLLGLGLAARATPFELALAALACCLPASLVCDLFPYPTARHVGSGPAVVPVYVGLAALCGLFALGRPRALAGALPAATRAGALIAFWATADGRLFQRDGQSAILFLATAALLVVATYGGQRLRALRDGPGRAVAILSALLIAWWALAAALGDSWRMGVQSLMHLVTGLAIAAALASALDEDGATRAIGGVVWGLVAACVLLAAALLEMLPHNDLARIVGSRLRLFDTHPNQIAPLFAGGVCLLAPLVFLPRGERSGVGLPRAALASILLVLVGALAWTRSRGSSLALLVGLVITIAGMRGALPRRPLRALAPLALLGLAGVAALASPFAADVRERLFASTFVQSALGQRFHLWRSATAAIADQPWFGVGPAQYYVHARFAEPSFYDGMNQGAHPHSIVLAAGESAGIPGMLLFLAVIGVVLELGRRRVLDAREPVERRSWAGLLGAVCAVLAADAFDLAQSGPTLMPLLIWVALGLFAAGCLAPAPGAPSRVLQGAALVLLVPLALMPMAGKLGSIVGRQLMNRDEAWRAARVYDALAWVHPWNRDAPSSMVDAQIRLGHDERALELVARQCRESPGRILRWRRYGNLLLADARPAEALAAFEAAVAADPRGSLSGALALDRARALVALGREDEARALLLEGLIQTGSEWSELPEEIPLAELLAELARRGLELAQTDEVLARRMIGRVIEGHRVAGDPAAALEVIRAYSALVEPMASIQVLEVQLLCQLGDFEGAAAAYHASPHAPHPFMTAAYLRGIGPSEGTPRERDYLELPLDLRGTGNMDPFFAAELSANVFDVEAHRALARGDEPGALRFLRRALYHLVLPEPRLVVAERFFARAAELRCANETLAAAFSTLLEEASRAPAVARDTERVTDWMDRLRAAWQGGTERIPPELEGAVERAGAVGAALREVW